MCAHTNMLAVAFLLFFSSASNPHENPRGNFSKMQISSCHFYAENIVVPPNIQIPKQHTQTLTHGASLLLLPRSCPASLAAQLLAQEDIHLSREPILSTCRL
jgi:hypothetical protein